MHRPQRNQDKLPLSNCPISNSRRPIATSSRPGPYIMSMSDWRANALDDAEYAFLLFHPDPRPSTTPPYLSTTSYPVVVPPRQPPLGLSDDDMLDEIFQEIMSPGPQDPPNHHHSNDLHSFPISATSALLSPIVASSSAPSTPQLATSQRRGSIPSASLGSISPNMTVSLRSPLSMHTNSTRSTSVFFPMLSDPKVRNIPTHYNAHPPSLLFPSPTARRNYRRMARMQKKKPASRICRMSGCTKGIRSRGLCKAHGGGRRCTTPGCEISDQGGGHCIAHGGGRRCSIIGCQKSAQSKGLCKLHGGARLCRLPDCNKNGQIKGLCRLHYSLTMATKHTNKTSGTGMTKFDDILVTRSPCDAFELQV